MGKVVKKELSEVVPVEENGVKLCTSSESIKLCSYCKKTESSLRIEGGVRNSRDMVAIFEHIHASGVPNFQGCKVRVGLKFKMSTWRSKLASYEDKIVCDYLEYGFPMDIDKKKELSFDVRKNHKGARDFPKFIEKYLKKECEQNRTAGPFAQTPLSVPLVVSPMNSVPKSNSDDERRLIVDLSWPVGFAVNEGISKDVYRIQTIVMALIESAIIENICWIKIGKFGTLLFTYLYYFLVG